MMAGTIPIVGKSFPKMPSAPPGQTSYLFNIIEKPGLVSMALVLKPMLPD
jgi:hypothetical protein